MLPWLGVLAGTLAAKMGSADKRKAAAGEILAKNAAKMGGDTSAIDAAVANKRIEGEESQALTNMFIQQLVGKLQAQPGANMGTDVTQDKLGGMAGQTGLQYDTTTNAAGKPQQVMIPGYGQKSSVLTPEYEEELRQSWRRR